VEGSLSGKPRDNRKRMRFEGQPYCGNAQL
jgi:hypothetical protein